MAGNPLLDINNLSDVSDAATARENLDVDSKEEGQARVDKLGLLVPRYAQLEAPDGPKLIGRCSDITTARSIEPTIPGQQIDVVSYYAGWSSVEIPPGGGIFVFDAADTTSTDDGALCLVTPEGKRWKRVYDGTLSLQDFGAKGDGITDDTLLISFALASGIPLVEKYDAIYRLTSKLELPNGKFTLRGRGMGRTVFNLDHYQDGIRLGTSELSTIKFPIELRDFSIIRLNPDDYTGISGPKSLYVSNGSGVLIDNVEESGAIGFGMQIDYSINSRVNNCYVHDHKGGMNGASGTDGIHHYRCSKVIVSGCRIERVGDDAISAGSYREDVTAEDIIYCNNFIYSCGGSMKIYSFAKKVKIYANTFDTGREGGVYLTSDANNQDGGFVEGVDIFDNIFMNIIGAAGNIEGGALRLRHWPNNPTYNCRIKNIIFHDNYIFNCRVMVSTASYDSKKRFSNLFINNNHFDSPPLDTTGDNSAIRINQMDGNLFIESNLFTNVHSAAIEIEPHLFSYIATNVNFSPKLNYNKIHGYSQFANSSGGSSRAIFIHEDNYNTILQMVGNEISSNGIPDTFTSLNQEILVGKLSPLSNISGNATERGSISISGGTAAYKGEKSLSAAPSAGTHYTGERIANSNRVSGQPSGWQISKSGTFESLSDGILATGAVGSRRVSVTGASFSPSDVSGIYRGRVIMFAGISTRYIIVEIDPTNSILSLDTSLTVALSNSAVTSPPPIYITEANFGF